MCDFGLKNGHFWPLLESPPGRGENLDFPNLAQKVSSNPLLESGCKISMTNAIKRCQYCQMCDFGLKIVILAPSRVSPGWIENFDLPNLA